MSDTILKDGFNSLVDRIFGENIKNLPQADQDALFQVFIGGAAVIGKHVLFTNYNSMSEYEPIGVSLRNELVSYAQGGVLIKEPEEAMKGAGELLPMSDFPMDGLTVEVLLYGQYHHARYNVMTSEYLVIREIADETQYAPFEMGDAAGWRELVTNCQGTAVQLPEGYKTMESAPKDGSYVWVIANVPAEGEELKPFKCYWREAINAFAKDIKGDGPRKVKPVAWTPILH